MKKTFDVFRVDDLGLTEPRLSTNKINKFGDAVYATTSFNYLYRFLSSNNTIYRLTIEPKNYKVFKNKLEFIRTIGSLKKDDIMPYIKENGIDLVIIEKSDSGFIEYVIYDLDIIKNFE